MDTLRNILVGLELTARAETVTDGSRNAFDQALAVGEKTGASITLLHSTYGASSRGRVNVHEGVSEEARRNVQDLIERSTTRGVECRLVVVDERPWWAIVQTVLRGEADLVVVGKRDQIDKGARRIGTVSVKLLRKCPCPVWVVKPGHDLAHKLVLAATDLSAVGDQAVSFGAWISNTLGSALHVVHAYQIPLELQMSSPGLGEAAYAREVDKIKGAAQAHIEGQLTGFEVGSGPELHIGRNNPSTAIREAVAHLQPDLLIMGTVSRGGIPGFLVGNTAEKVLETVDCSILAVKPSDFACPVQADQRIEG